MIGIGPFPVRVVIVFGAVLLAWAVARLIARRLPDGSYKNAAGGLLLDGVFWGVLAARLGYIAQWWEEYAAAPASMIAIGDGGFTWWIGVVAALLFVWWRSRTMSVLRIPVVAGITAGVLGWFAGGGMLTLLHQSGPPLADVQVSTLDARPLGLSAYAGRPVVLNLWASWCPPCRREMPVFAQAQQDFPQVAFVMLNQGESAQQALAFLQGEQLRLKDVLLDPSSQAMQVFGSRGLPTTLFFDEQGRLVDTHMGELTTASLRSTLMRRFGQVPNP
ncbi:prolipoprotein diacylglyceryl transferase family protein [Thauera sp. Sel9]|uniref:prolipoprotein diacylglyceryl transferase family protein n=1 Tax=Thauera sp. Sel9 TaxID=2974299 RepID=UPI0021E138EC|nr:TlpA disulfide reductase family protein [Thauera sp. Sel9]MCV2217275.1 TlpA family protein disulfide reductase [Thauera sp. Sel9]